MGSQGTNKRRRQRKLLKSRRPVEISKKMFDPGLCSWRDVYKAIPNRGQGDCGPLSVIFLALHRGGMDAHTAQCVLSTQRKELADFILLCRELIVEYQAATGEGGAFFVSQSDSDKPDADIKSMAKSTADICTLEDWKRVTLCPGGYLDDKALVILGKLLLREVIQLVKEDGIGGERIVDAREPSALLGANLVLHRGAHFEALLPKDDLRANDDTGDAGGEVWYVK
ncbi:unnamed protein product, partial [Ectocarpus sp. 6 AP-2014]